jgi:crossover junction endodeoxyribonuclease RuvC
LSQESIILGIDPGTNLMGYGIIKITGNKPSLLSMGVIHLVKYDNHALKLKRIFERVSGIIREYKPDEMALEAPFFGKNVQSMLKLGRAQGVAMAAGLSLDVPIVEYSPRKIKQSITGSGAASKEQVAAMLKSIFKYKETPQHLDATDGLAVALCHYYQKGTITASKNYSGWEAFVKQNPKRTK